MNIFINIFEKPLININPLKEIFYELKYSIYVEYYINYM